MRLYGMSEDNGLGSFTWANRPSALAGQRAFFTDIAGGVDMIFDGALWRPKGIIDIGGLQAHVYIQSSGTIGNNGALTLTTGLAFTYSNGVYFYFPANAIFAGSAAGVYYVVMSSTTVGTIYNNTYTSGIPKFISSPTPFVTTGPGAYTQTISTDITLVSHVLKGNLLKNFGSLEITDAYINNNSANNKTRKILLNGATYNDTFNTTNTTGRDNLPGYFLTNSTIGRGSFVAGYSGNGAAGANSSLDLTIDQTFAFTGRLAVATDYIGIAQASIILH